MSEIKASEATQSEMWNSIIRAEDGVGIGAVRVVHWNRQGILDRGRCINSWNIYVYLFQHHAAFNRFTGITEQNYISSDTVLDFHGGCTYFQRSWNSEGRIVRVKLGCDYAHYGDEQYEDFATKEDAWKVFSDAQDLITQVIELHKSKNNALPENTPLQLLGDSNG